MAREGKRGEPCLDKISLFFREKISGNCCCLFFRDQKIGNYGTGDGIRVLPICTDEACFQCVSSSHEFDSLERRLLPSSSPLERKSPWQWADSPLRLQCYCWALDDNAVRNESVLKMPRCNKRRVVFGMSSSIPANETAKIVLDAGRCFCHCRLLAH